MKFKVHMKDPDTLNDAIEHAVRESVKDLPLEDDTEREAIQETRCEKIRELCSAWFEYSEYLTVEIDTDAGTCTVVTR